MWIFFNCLAVMSIGLAAVCSMNFAESGDPRQLAGAVSYGLLAIHSSIMAVVFILANAMKKWPKIHQCP